MTESKGKPLDKPQIDQPSWFIEDIEKGSGAKLPPIWYGVLGEKTNTSFLYIATVFALIATIAILIII